MADAARTARALVAALRMPQWVKNVLVFVPVVLDHEFTNADAVSRAFLGFAAFCLAASAGYIFNDIHDIEADRKHPEKRRRPFAAGTLSVGAGKIAAGLLLAAAAGISLLLPPDFRALLLVYLISTASYSLWFKEIPVLDVLILASLYALRVLAGIAAAEVRFSAWLLAFAMFLFLSLAFVKRYSELFRLRAESATAADRRGYTVDDLSWLGSMGASAGYLSVLVLALYIDSPQVRLLYTEPWMLWLACPLLLYWIGRMWMKAHRGRIAEDPIVATARDPVSYGIAAIMALILAAAL
ncbi:MAG: UbiA family prenyltransferase [Gemmatimonadota bacterium]|nr:UbiA family prenyltransferase [Gemmatimonadota bacterium]